MMVFITQSSFPVIIRLINHGGAALAHIHHSQLLITTTVVIRSHLSRSQFTVSTHSSHSAVIINNRYSCTTVFTAICTATFTFGNHTSLTDVSLPPFAGVIHRHHSASVSLSRAQHCSLASHTIDTRFHLLMHRCHYMDMRTVHVFRIHTHHLSVTIIHGHHFLLGP